MRAKNEFRNIAANYDTKLILERVVDGKLMCPEACCGAPVVECTCGPDCPHCNCFMIHKAMKEKDFTNKLLKEEVVSEGAGKDLWSLVTKLFRPKPVPKPGATVRLGQVREPVTVRLGPAQAASSIDKAVDVSKFKARSKLPAELLATGAQAAAGGLLPDELHAPEVDQPGKWSIPDVQTHSATGRPAPTKSIISKTKDLIPTIPVNEQRDLSGGWESSRDRAGEMEAKEKAMRKKIERIKRQKPAPQGRLTMPGDPDRDDTFTLEEMHRDIMNGMTAKESMERMGIHPINQKNLLAKYLKWSEEWSEGPIEDNEGGHPAGGIRSFREKPPELDAFAKAAFDPKRSPELHSMHSFANRKGETQKPYISSYKGVFEVMDEHNNVIFTTRNRRKAHKWYKEYMKTFRAEDEEEREPHWPHLPII
mgnify:FL=1|tara:strand:- start:21 stop:1286 length:1266 start_codon:yes stop_codon:yes gene_type:complete